MRTDKSLPGEMCAYQHCHRALGMAMGSGVTRNTNTGGSWEEGQESVEEVYDVGLRRRWEERKKVTPLSWEDNMEHWNSGSGGA